MVTFFFSRNLVCFFFSRKSRVIDMGRFSRKTPRTVRYLKVAMFGYLAVLQSLTHGDPQRLGWLGHFKWFFSIWTWLGGGNSYIFPMFTPKLGEDDFHFDEHIFQRVVRQTTFKITTLANHSQLVLNKTLKFGFGSSKVLPKCRVWRWKS